MGYVFRDKEVKTLSAGIVEFMLKNDNVKDTSEEEVRAVLVTITATLF